MDTFTTLLPVGIKGLSSHKSTKKKFGGDVDGFPDLFNSTGKLNLSMNKSKTKDLNDDEG